VDDITQSGFRILLLDLLGMADGTVRPADTTQPSEGDEYAIVQFSETDAQGFGGTAIDPDQLDAELRQQLHHLTVTVDFFGQRAGVLAQRLPLVLTHDVAIQQLDDLGLGLLDCSSARNLSALELDRIKRYQLRLMLSAVAQSTQSLNAMQSVDISVIV
jgi:hypothetical protein